MTEIKMTHFDFSFDASDERNRFHDVAIDEARVVTDLRGEQVPAAQAAPAQRNVLGRLRLAFAGGPALSEPCDCPA